MNRVIDTLIGIFVSLGVNVFHFPRRKNSRLLFVSDLDGLVDSEGQVSSYSKIKLNQLIQKGALITVASRLSSASAAPVLNDININIPIITLDGAAMYDLAAKTYLYCKFITYPDAAEILDVFDKYGLNCFVYTVINDFLHIYYGDFTNPAEEKMYHANKLHPLKNYVYSPLPENRGVVYFRAVDTPDMVHKLYRDLLRLKCSDRINVTYRKDESSEHYCFLEIYSAEASKANAVFELEKRLNADRTAAFGCGGGDIEMINNADYGYAVRNASEDLLEMAPNIIGDGGSDSVVKMIEKLFYSKKLI